MEEAKLQKGMLLAASPDIDDPNFVGKVILLCEHSAAGSFGLVINKELEIDPSVDNELMEQLNHPNVHLMLGGPVRQGQMMLLHTNDSKKQEMLQINDGTYLGGDLNFLQESLSSNDCGKLFLCFGYTGWGFRELEREVAENFWCVCPSNAEIIFQTEADKIWNSVLSKVGGKYNSFKNFPSDLADN